MNRPRNPTTNDQDGSSPTRIAPLPDLSGPLPDLSSDRHPAGPRSGLARLLEVPNEWRKKIGEALGKRRLESLSKKTDRQRRSSGPKPDKPARQAPKPRAKVDVAALGTPTTVYGAPIAKRRLSLYARLSMFMPSGNVLLAIGVGAAAVWTTLNWTSASDAAPRERGLVVSATDVAARTGKFEVEREAESLIRKRTLIGDVTIEYRYAPEGPYAPRVAMNTNLARNEDAAKKSFASSENSELFEWKRAGDREVSFVLMNEDFAWGDESRAHVVLVDGWPVGHKFTGRSGSNSVHLMIRGTSCDAADLAAVLNPILSRVERQRD